MSVESVTDSLTVGVSHSLLSLTLSVTLTVDRGGSDTESQRHSHHNLQLQDTSSEVDYKYN